MLIKQSRQAVFDSVMGQLRVILEFHFLQYTAAINTNRLDGQTHFLGRIGKTLP